MLSIVTLTLNQYVQSGNEFFRALPYLDPSKVNEVFNQIRESGFIQDFILVNGSEFDVGHSIERSSTISHKDRAVTGRYFFYAGVYPIKLQVFTS